MALRPSIRPAIRAQLQAPLQDLPDDAKTYVMATKVSVDKAVEPASRTEEKDVFLRTATTNVLWEPNGVNLIAYVD